MNEKASVETSEHGGSMDVTVMSTNLGREEGDSIYKIKRKPVVTHMENTAGGGRSL